MTKEDLYRDIYRHFVAQMTFLIVDMNRKLTQETPEDNLHPYYDAYNYLKLYVRILQELQITLDNLFLEYENAACTPETKAALEEKLSALQAQLRLRTTELEGCL